MQTCDDAVSCVGESTVPVSARLVANPRTPRLWSGHLVWIAVTAAAFGVAFFARIEPPARVYLFGSLGPLPPSCTFQSATGLACPGCGLTRSVISTAHGEIAAAWSYHPPGTVIAVLLFASMPYRLWQHVRWRRGRATPAFGKVEGTALITAAIVSLVWRTSELVLML